MKIRILSKLPAGDSKAFSLNMLDALKLLRLGMVSVAGVVATYGIPYVTGRMWTVSIGDQMLDATGAVVAVATLTAEALRRWSSNNREE